MADLFSHPSEGSNRRFDQSGWLGQGASKRSVSVKSLTADAFGVYRVTAQLDGEGVLFGQRRNLIDPDAQKGDNSFLTVLTEYIPSMDSRIHADKTLFASTYGCRVTGMSAERVENRRVFIAGDSTVADQYSSLDYYPFDSYCGWGQMLSALLKDDAWCNMAHSGLTGRCFTEDGHFDIVKKYLQKGDLMLIQFGHNDQKRRYLQADKRYTEYLGLIAREAEKAGALPVLLSPISRVPGRDAGGVFDLLEEHAEAVKRLAEKMSLPFIDLHAYTFQLFCEMGESCRDLFKDMTHTNDPGALKIASYVARKLEEFSLAKAHEVSAGFIAGDRARNPAKGAPSELPVPYVDIEGVPDCDVVYRGVQAGLLDPCVLHMHPFEPLSRGQFIQLLFRAALIPSRPTDGLAPYRDVKPREFDAAYAAACRQMGLVAGEYYRPDDDVTAREVNDFCEKLGLSPRLADEPPVPCKYERVRLLLKVRDEAAARRR